ncbi:c-type cytochrome [Edaphobacter aggregans]|uniref:c-type cytochrome n=1 Tax=Edaphobacter aggregans TaxID=570835 RepID=UPI00068F6C28|nr:c-type cytochrome [Edaphobacter aggregans]
MHWRALIAIPACLLCLPFAGCKVAPAGKAETAILEWTKHNVTVGGKKDTNPIKASAETIEAGKVAFGFYCVVCHGRDAQNTGVPFAKNMSPPLPSLASDDVQRYTDGQLKWIIENGISPSGMPASKGILSDDDMWTIVVYLRHLPPAGSLGEPRAYSGEEYAK